MLPPWWGWTLPACVCVSPTLATEHGSRCGAAQEEQTCLRKRLTHHSLSLTGFWARFRLFFKKKKVKGGVEIESFYYGTLSWGVIFLNVNPDPGCYFKGALELKPFWGWLLTLYWLTRWRQPSALYKGWDAWRVAYWELRTLIFLCRLWPILIICP